MLSGSQAESETSRYTIIELILGPLYAESRTALSTQQTGFKILDDVRFINRDQPAKLRPWVPALI